MKSHTTLFLILLVFTSVPATVYAQQPELATYRESAHVLVDDVAQNQTSAFITLETPSNLEMRVPTDLDNSIHNAQNVTSVRITNAANCVFVTAYLGNGSAPQYSCVIITISDQSLINSFNITKIQSVGQVIGNSMIDKINNAFDINAKFFQVFVRGAPRHELSATPLTSNTPASNATINAVYIFPYQKTNYLFDSLSSILLPQQIRNAGGYFDAAREMSNFENSSVTFAILPQQNNTSLYQLQVERIHPLTQGQWEIKPLELLGINELNRSSYFNVGFFPLNSLLEVTAISRNNIAVTSHCGNELPTTLNNGQKVPTDLTKPGWIFDPASGNNIFAVYLFGTTTYATDNDLCLTIAPSNGQPASQIVGGGTPTTAGPDNSIYIIVGIVAAGGGAIYLFTRRR